MCVCVGHVCTRVGVVHTCMHGFNPEVPLSNDIVLNASL